MKVKDKALGKKSVVDLESGSAQEPPCKVRKKDVESETNKEGRKKERW